MSVELNPNNIVVDSEIKSDFVGRVVNSYYGYSENYLNGERPLMIWEVVDLDEGDESEPHQQLISIGNNWEIEGGEAVGDFVTPTKGQKGFNSQTTIGMILKRLIDGEYGEKAQVDLFEKNLRHASNWIGTEWFFSTVQVKDYAKKGADGKPDMRDKLLPTKYMLGVEEKEAKTKTVAQKTSSRQAAESSTQKQPAAPKSQEPKMELVKKLKAETVEPMLKAAIEAQSNAEFLQKSLQVDPGMFAVPELASAASSGKLYEELRALAEI